MAALGYIPKTKAFVSALFCQIPLELTAVVLAVGAHGVNRHAFLVFAKAERGAVERISRDLGKIIRHEFLKGIGPAFVDPAEALGGQAYQGTAQECLASLGCGGYLGYGRGHELGEGPRFFLQS